eukprot:SAG31_NODE_28842_length_404_cov_1.118033_2_plen_75_part_01
MNYGCPEKQLDRLILIEVARELCGAKTDADLMPEWTREHLMTILSGPAAKRKIIAERRWKALSKEERRSCSRQIS